MKQFRRLVFWVHLGCGLVAGGVIAVMSATGVAIAFEHEILEHIDRPAATVAVPETGGRLGISDQIAALRAARPEFRPTAVTLARDPSQATRFSAGQENLLYLDPHTGAVAEPRSGRAHALLHTLEAWHRWLGARDGVTSGARLVTGACNLAFLGLCLTGLYLWFPRRWSRRAFRPLLWFVGRVRGKARDFNWHNVIGLWSAPVLIVLAATGVVISFGWAHDLVFRPAGESPPRFRDFRMMAVPAPAVPVRAAGVRPLELDALVAAAAARFPDWQTMQFNLPKPGELTVDRPFALTVFEPAPFSTAGRVMVSIDPVSGAVLQRVAFADRSPGLRARVWARFLHTGEAFGFAGKIVATVATAASLVLVWTGFALSWRRFFPRRVAAG